MTTLNLILSVKVLYDLFRLVYPSINYQVLSTTNKSPTIVYRSYNARQLSEFNGNSPNKPILIAIGGFVFDVTKGATFYGPGGFGLVWFVYKVSITRPIDGPYGNFAGRDASRGMALHSFDQDVLTPIDQPRDTLSDLTAEQR